MSGNKGISMLLATVVLCLVVVQAVSASAGPPSAAGAASAASSFSPNGLASAAGANSAASSFSPDNSASAAGAASAAGYSGPASQSITKIVSAGAQMLEKIVSQSSKMSAGAKHQVYTAAQLINKLVADEIPTPIIDKVITVIHKKIAESDDIFTAASAESSLVAASNHMIQFVGEIAPIIAESQGYAKADVYNALMIPMIAINKTIEHIGETL